MSDYKSKIKGLLIKADGIGVPISTVSEIIGISRQAVHYHLKEIDGVKRAGNRIWIGGELKYRICSKCQKKRLLEDFGKNPQDSVAGRKRKCKFCANVNYERLPIGEKRCTACGEVKIESEFGILGDGLNPKCKKCMREYRNANYDPESQRERHEKWLRSKWKKSGHNLGFNEWRNLLQRRYFSEYIDNAGDGYVRALLKRMGLPDEALYNQDLIDLKRAQILFKRQLKNHKDENNI